MQLIHVISELNSTYINCLVKGAQEGLHDAIRLTSVSGLVELCYVHMQFFLFVW